MVNPQNFHKSELGDNYSRIKVHKLLFSVNLTCISIESSAPKKNKRKALQSLFEMLLTI